MAIVVICITSNLVRPGELGRVTVLFSSSQRVGGDFSKCSMTDVGSCISPFTVSVIEGFFLFPGQDITEQGNVTNTLFRGR